MSQKWNDNFLKKILEIKSISRRFQRASQKSRLNWLWWWRSHFIRCTTTSRIFVSKDEITSIDNNRDEICHATSALASERKMSWTKKTLDTASDFDWFFTFGQKARETKAYVKRTKYFMMSIIVVYINLSVHVAV